MKTLQEIQKRIGVLRNKRQIMDYRYQNLSVQIRQKEEEIDGYKQDRAQSIWENTEEARELEELIIAEKVITGGGGK
ncbi:MAG: hypothetical protein Q4A42_02760 [Tissierellia bacterium]|nr:hypothetical protein [Tissierellia bacterium]